MVDRSAREKVSNNIIHYLTKKNNCDQFLKNLRNIRKRTKDRTLKHIIDSLHPYYDVGDEYEDKEVWDMFNRVSLFLHSDIELEHSSKGIWKELLAGLTFILLFFIFLFFFIYLFFNAAIFSVVPCLLFLIGFLVFTFKFEKNKYQQIQNEFKEYKNLFPFPSVSSILKLKRKNPTFRKLPFSKPNYQKLKVISIGIAKNYYEGLAPNHFDFE